jgi:hypothetical protein
MTTLIKCFRVYAMDGFGAIYDYKTFLTAEECSVWAQTECPTYSHNIGSHIIGPDNGRFTEIAMQLESLTAQKVLDTTGRPNSGIFGL